MTLRVVCISDTHGRPLPPVPDGDVLVHCGDALYDGGTDEFVQFADWFRNLPHKHKIYVPGNHDFTVERNPSWCEAQFGYDEVHMLINRGVEIEGKKFYGWPWISNLTRWAFCSQNYPRLNFNDIPAGLDMLITHGPPKGILDVVDYVVGSVGSRRLKHQVLTKKPKYHVFGHIHECGGMDYNNGDTTFANVACLDRSYRARREIGYVVDLD